MRRLLIIIFLSVTVIFVIMIMGFAAGQPGQSMVQFVEAQSINDLVNGSLTAPIVIFYPATESGSVFVFKDEDAFSYVQIESSDQSFWMYESGGNVRNIDDVRKALGLLTYVGSHHIQVGSCDCNADLWHGDAENGGAIIFQEAGTNVAFFWHKLHLSNVKEILAGMKKLE